MFDLAVGGPSAAVRNYQSKLPYPKTTPEILFSQPFLLIGFAWGYLGLLSCLFAPLFGSGD